MAFSTLSAMSSLPIISVRMLASSVTSSQLQTELSLTASRERSCRFLFMACPCVLTCV
jgi:hypothetical protein